MALLECREIEKSFSLNGKPLPILESISFSVEKAETIVLLGKSGCGKSSLLRILAGLVQPNQGEVLLEGKPLLRPTPDVSIVFQSYAVFPWMTVLGNVEAGLVHRSLSRAERRQVALHYLSLVGLAEFAKSRPATLSGGMQQRVALARSFAMNPKVLLMDEPFGALDAFTRQEMQQELLRINSEEHKAVVFVTHDIEEAVLLGTRVLVLSYRPARIAAVFARSQEVDRADLFRKIAGCLQNTLDTGDACGRKGAVLCPKDAAGQQL